MPRYVDAELLLEELQKAAEKEGVKSEVMADAKLYDCSAKYSHGQYCYENAQEIVRSLPTIIIVEVQEKEREEF